MLGLSRACWSDSNHSIVEIPEDTATSKKVSGATPSFWNTAIMSWFASSSRRGDAVLCTPLLRRVEEKNSFSIGARVAVDSSKSGLTSKNNCFAVGRKKSSPTSNPLAVLIQVLYVLLFMPQPCLKHEHIPQFIFPIAGSRDMLVPSFPDRIGVQESLILQFFFGQ